MRSLVTSLGCVLTCVATCAATASAQSAVTEPQVVVAQAEVILKRAPDLARVTLATEVRDGKAAEARRKSAEAMTAVQAAVKAVGISGDAIHTSGFSLVPEMTYASGKLSVRNYVVRNQIEIRIDDLDKLADVIDAANSPKNVAIAVGNPRFELKAREAAELDAVAAAVKAAKARAVAMATGRVDIYATGCVAYWLLTGQTVFTADTTMGLLLKHLQEPPASPSTRGVAVPAALDRLVLACLAKDPNDRPQSARALASQLAEIGGGAVWTEDRARGWWAEHQPIRS
jgi:uncharacterized protein YggE